MFAVSKQSITNPESILLVFILVKAVEKFSVCCIELRINKIIIGILKKNKMRKNYLERQSVLCVSFVKHE